MVDGIQEILKKSKRWMKGNSDEWHNSGVIEKGTLFHSMKDTKFGRLKTYNLRVSLCQMDNISGVKPYVGLLPTIAL
jgi:hypothetical protein